MITQMRVRENSERGEGAQPMHNVNLMSLSIPDLSV